MSQNNDSEEVKHDSYMRSIFRQRCNTCFRSKADGKTGWLDLGDGRKLCSDCSSIAVMNSDEWNPIIQSVFEFYKSEKLNVDKNIPILFVDRKQMKRLYKDGADGLFIPSIWDFLNLPSAFGLPIKMTAIFIRLFMGRIHTIEKHSRNGGGTKKVVKFVLGRAILLLSGLPDIEMGEILAHEMMHAWIQLQGVARGRCERKTEEGISQVMSYKWLQWFSSSGGFDKPHKTNQQVQHTKKLWELLVETIQCQPDEVYGQGFIDAMRAIETFGFKPTLDHIIKNRTLPQPMMECTYSPATFTTVEFAKALKEFLVEKIRSKRNKLVEVCVRRFLDVIRAIETFGFKSILDHVITTRALPQLIMDSTCFDAVSVTVVECTEELKEDYVIQVFIDSVRAIGIVGFESILDHVVKNRTLLQLMRDSTWSAAAAELIRENTGGATPKLDQVLCKASSNTTKSFWKATVATTINCIQKAATSCKMQIIFGSSEVMLSAIVSVAVTVFEHR